VQVAALRAAETIGRRLGSQRFLDRIAALTDRDTRPGKTGPKRKTTRRRSDLARRRWNPRRI
jgi:hypothetical protein